jgi:hypothetical protein
MKPDCYRVKPVFIRFACAKYTSKVSEMSSRGYSRGCGSSQSRVFAGGIPVGYLVLFNIPGEEREINQVTNV